MIAKLEDGREFPSYNGEALSWSFGLYMTPNEEREGFPRAKAVLSELPEERLNTEYRDFLKGIFCRIFGHNARKALRLVEEEKARRNAHAD